VPADAAAVGHRVVHGGARFREPVAIDAGLEAAIRELRSLAPLHNEPALRGIAYSRASRCIVRWKYESETAT